MSVDALKLAFVDGDAVARSAAADALLSLGVVIDAALAEDALAVTLARGTSTARADDVHALLSCLASSDAGAALEAVVSRLPSDDELADDARGREALAIPRLIGAWRTLDIDAKRERVDALHMRTRAQRDDADRGLLRRALCLVIDDDDCRDIQRERAAESLFDLGTRGDVESFRSLAARSRSAVVPGALVIKASLAADPAEAYEELHESYSVDAYRRRLIGTLVDETADPRWVAAALGVMDVDPAAATSTLAHLRTPRAAEELLHLAAGQALDDVTRHALAALGTLGDSRGALLLVRWLVTPEGDAIAPLLLTALAGCGNATTLPFLEDRLAEASPDRGLVDAGRRWSYVRHAVDAIRARLGEPRRD